MRRPVRSCLALAMTIGLAACGSTGNIKPEPKGEVVSPTSEHTPAPSGKIDLSRYDKLVVLDFQDATDKSGIKPDKIQSYSDTVATATRSFADLIAQKVRESKAFPDVSRGPSPGTSLIVSGHITRLVEGNSFARLMLPGAGMSHFEATTDLTDGESGQVIGHVATDKNSWALGGGIAAGQSVQNFMQGAAEKIADQLKQQKQGTQVAKTH